MFIWIERALLHMTNVKITCAMRKFGKAVEGISRKKSHLNFLYLVKVESP